MDADMLFSVILLSANIINEMKSTSLKAFLVMILSFVAMNW